MKNLLYKTKHYLITIAKHFWNLNWEAKLGLLFLIPPIWGVFVCIMNIWGADIAKGWGLRYAYSNHTNYAVPLYLGLMAIVGAYLLKGNLTKQDKQHSLTNSNEDKKLFIYQKNSR